MNMRDIIAGQHEQIHHSLTVNQDVRVEGSFDSLVLTGMGGSGLPGDLFNALAITKKPLWVHHNYDLPLAYLGQMGLTQTLAIMSSYSGNTEESLTAYQDARENNIPLLTSSAGGTLAEWANRDSVPHILIDFPGMQPRHTLFAAFTGIYQALLNSGLVVDITDDLLRIASVMEEVVPQLEAPAKELADKMYGHTPLYLSSDNLGFAARNLKIQTNENAKYPAFWNTFPELNHNEMVSFSKITEANNPNKFFALMLRDPDDHPRNSARIDVTSELYEQWGVPVSEFTAQGKTLLEKLFYTTTFGMWLTYFLAEAQSVDPIPVPGVEDFKTKLTDLIGEIK